MENTIFSQMLAEFEAMNAEDQQAFRAETDARWADRDEAYADLSDKQMEAVAAMQLEADGLVSRRRGLLALAGKATQAPQLDLRAELFGE